MNDPTVTPEAPSLAEIGAAVDRVSAVTGIHIPWMNVSRYGDIPQVDLQRSHPRYTVEEGHRLLAALGVPASAITGRLLDCDDPFSTWTGRHGGVVWEVYTAPDPAHVETAEAAKAAAAAKAAEVQP